MRGAWLVCVATIGCDVGAVRIEDDAGTDDLTVDTDALDTDGADSDAPTTDPDSDTAVVDDTDPSPDTDTSGDLDLLSGVPIAWDAQMRWTFSAWWGGAPCVSRVTEQGEQVDNTHPRWRELVDHCASCQLFFEVRQTRTGAACLEGFEEVEWRAIEVRPTGKLRVVVLTRNGLDGSMDERHTAPNATLAGAEFPLRYDTFAPVYARTVVSGTVTLTPVP